MAFRLALFYAAVFGFLGVTLPYWPVWLADKGLDPVEIAVLLAVATWIRVAAPPLVAHGVDRRGERRRAMTLLAAAAFAAHLLFLAAEGFAALLAVSALAAVAFTPLIPMIEDMAVLAARDRRVDYGRVRLWGSLAFIVGAVGGGRALAGAGPPVVLALALAALACAALAAPALPDLRPPPSRHRLPAAALLARPAMWVFLLAASLVQASHAVYYGFSTLAWRAAGIDDRAIGLLWAEGVAAEIALFAFGGRLAARLGPAALLAIGGGAGAVRWSVLALEPGLWALAAVQALHALTFGAAHLGAMLFVARAVAPEHSASAQALYAGAAMGLATGGATVLGGALFDGFGAGAYWAMTALAACGGGFALALGAFRPDGSPRRGRRGRGRAGRRATAGNGRGRRGRPRPPGGPGS